MATDDTRRIDIFLWQARLAKTRVIAAEWAESGRIRLNGRPIEKAHALVRVGDVLTLPRPAAILVYRILRLPDRRGPAAEAATLIEILDQQRL